MNDCTLAIDAGPSQQRTAPFKQGIFFEDYNHGGDGGLYAELVRNRSFEDADTPDAWSLKVVRGTASMALDRTQPLNSNNPTALRIDMHGAAQLINAGYWGMHVVQGAEYKLQCHVRGDFRGRLEARLLGSPVDIAGPTLAATPCALEADGNAWQRLTATLTATAADPRGQFAFALEGEGTLWMDMVSLMPATTWRGRPNGLRPDVAQLIADLAPKFVRFPGGTNLEGFSPDACLRWKNAIGDIAERPGVMQCWGYRLTEGLGYHEFLQWCEDLGAEPLFTINCGLMAQWRTQTRITLDALEPWVQDALDAIEYANGPVESAWGAMRAAHGHAAPFNLRYIEIGNENAGPMYEAHFARFYDAIKARYPHMQIVATCKLKDRTPDLVDEHYYGSAERLAMCAHQFDAYDRAGPKMIVTEYAAMAGAGMGNWAGALAEAAFLTGLERNSDIVAMGCYGGLFGNIDDPARTWDPNMIYLTTDRCYGTPSYQVQKMFADYAGDVVLPTKLVCNDVSSAFAAAGKIGVGSMATEVQFKEIRVQHNGETLLVCDGIQDWDPWHVPYPARQDVYTVFQPGDDVRHVYGDAHWRDCTITLKARKERGKEGFRIFFHYRDEKNWYCLRLGAWQNTRHVLEKCADGVIDLLGIEVSGEIACEQWHDVGIVLNGSSITCVLNGVMLMHFTELAPAEMEVAASAVMDSAAHTAIVRVVNRSSSEKRITVNMHGAHMCHAACVVLSAEPDCENSLARPVSIFAETQNLHMTNIDGVSKTTHIAPAYSFSILKLTP